MLPRCGRTRSGRNAIKHRASLNPQARRTPTSPLTTVYHRRRLPAIPPPRYNSRKGDLLMRRTNRVAWGLSALLAAVLLGSGLAQCVRLKAYWTAKYHGKEADLQGAVLLLAPL